MYYEALLQFRVNWGSAQLNPALLDPNPGVAELSAMDLQQSLRLRPSTISYRNPKR